MLRTSSAAFPEFRAYLDTVPVIDTHEHCAGILFPNNDLFSNLLGYYVSDLITAAGNDEQHALDAIYGYGLPFENRYAIFERFCRKSDKTAYFKGFKEAIRRCWGIEEISLASFRELDAKRQSLDIAQFDSFLRDNGIQLSVANISTEHFMGIVGGDDTNYSRLCRFAFPLPDFHDTRSGAFIGLVREDAGGSVSCLDDYVRGFDRLLDRSVRFGIACMKDQSAYWRRLDYGDPSKEEAEKVFDRIVQNPQNAALFDEGKVLDDWLFGHFMRRAGETGLPVQLHTGHLAGSRTDVRGANASHLIPLLQRHPDVQFALFHGNWPYMDDYLFIGKNFPNVYLDLCWAHTIDPLYTIELMKRAVMTVPHSKILVFGGDAFAPELTVGYLALARDNVACALTELTDSGWLSFQEAKEIAVDWFYNNPNEFFGFGCPTIMGSRF